MGTSLTTFSLKMLQTISYKSIRPYAEHLVVLREWESNTLVSKLQKNITKVIQKAVSGDPVVELVNVAQ